MSWVRELLSSASEGNRLSSKRLVMLMAGIVLSVSVILLSVAALNGHDMGAELSAVAIPLAGLGGFSYVGGRFAETRQWPGGMDAPPPVVNERGSRWKF